MSRGGFGRGGRGAERGARGGGRGGGRGGFQRQDYGPPENVLAAIAELGSFVHAVEDEMLCSSLIPDKVPHFNAPIYLQNKSQIGKIDEILGPVNEVYFSVKMEPGMVATSFKQGDKVYVSDQKLLPIERFLPKPKVIGGKIESKLRLLDTSNAKIFTVCLQNEAKQEVQLEVVGAVPQEGAPSLEAEGCAEPAGVLGVAHLEVVAGSAVGGVEAEVAGVANRPSSKTSEFLHWPNVISRRSVMTLPQTIELPHPLSAIAFLPPLQWPHRYNPIQNIKGNFPAFIDLTILKQRLVIDDIVKNPNKDQFIIAATGSGKSLLYELPAILPQSAGKTTIVFIPRVSIIRSELARLQQCGIPAESRYNIQSANSMQQLQEQNQRFARALREPALLPKLLLVTPNQLEYTGTNFQLILNGLCEHGLVQRFLSQLPILREKYPDIPISVLSASVSPDTVQNLSLALNITHEPKMFPLDRPNIYYHILSKLSSGEDGKMNGEPSLRELSQIVPVIHLARNVHPEGSGLVFCRTKKGCLRFAQLLKDRGVQAEAFDSELNNSDAGFLTFCKWRDNDPSVQILVSTVCAHIMFWFCSLTTTQNTLSSGVHKPDIRFVVHTSIPTSGIDGYMQETGRAGRDNLNATCLLLYSFGDAFKVAQQTAYETNSLLALLWLINSTNCRRRALLSYYGDKLFRYTSPNSRCCDVCDGMTGERPSLDVTSLASRVLRYCESRQDMKGRKDLARRLSECFNAKGHREPTQDMWDRFIQWLIVEQYLEVQRPGERGGGQLKVVRSPKTNNLLRQGGQQVHLPWSLRFNELHVRKADEDFPLRWTEEVVRSLDTHEEIASSRESSQEL
ncbi:Bloom syndrome protein [Ceratobasidium theobromae]|uniref:H/ACA ribonucleoprotein complex subunit GAR1 n=1 Tax=Ceratobasidium theobromae TaxID=1582974 RepID=A0A5N5QXD3_9AGAM|nr:Bloom syndrome protein [Ceratobasidium theobromae]